MITPGSLYYRRQLARILPACLEAVRLSNPALRPATLGPGGDGYVAAVERLDTAAKTLETACILAKRCSDGYEFEKVHLALSYARVAKDNARRARSLIFSSRIADNPEAWLRDSNYLDPDRRGLLDSAERMCQAANTLHSKVHNLAYGLRPSAVSSRAKRPVTRSAMWVATSSVRILPIDHRSRYFEEFASELADSANLPRRQQLALALRQGSRVWLLRRALGREAQPVPVRER